MDWESEVLCTHWGTYDRGPKKASGIDWESEVLRSFHDVFEINPNNVSIADVSKELISAFSMLDSALGDGKVEWVSIISKYDSDGKKLVLKGEYEGGNIEHCFYGHNLILTVGGRRIYVIDMNEFVIVREFTVDSPVFSMQYEPANDALFVFTGKILVIYDILRTT